MARIRGLEMLFSLVRKELKSKEDCLIAALHCILINEGLQCVGIGEAFSEFDLDSKTELLPKQWNENQDVYTLRYINKDLKYRYLVKIVKVGHILHVNVVLNEEKAAHLSVDINKHINDDFKEYENTFSDLDSLKESVKRDLWDKLHKKSNAESKPPTKVKEQTTPIVPAPVPSGFTRPSPMLEREFVDIPPFPNVGQQDLDPFGRGFGGGGMLMDPSSLGYPSRPHMPPFGGLPRGSVPPGARFDPFGPPIRGPNRGNPDPDHLRRDDFY